MIVAGKNAVKECIKSKRALKVHIIKNSSDRDYKEIAELCKNSDIKVFYEDREELDRLSQGMRHQGVVAKTPDFQYCDEKEIIDDCKNKGFMLLIDEVSDPHNFGNIIRTAECAGCCGIIIPKHRTCEVTETVIKVSVGACFHIKIAKTGNINDFIRKIKDEFIEVYALDMDGENIYETHLATSCAFIIGSEGFGVKKLTASLADKKLSIPQKGSINSLNAANAAAVAMYEYVRQHE